MTSATAAWRSARLAAAGNRSVGRDDFGHFNLPCGDQPTEYAMPSETFSMRIEVGPSVYDGSLSLEDGRLSGLIEGTVIEGMYDLDGESFAAQFHSAPESARGDLFGPGRSSATLSGTLATDPSHLTGTTGHDDGINMKATLTRQAT